jgi:hypothetical protein
MANTADANARYQRHAAIPCHRLHGHTEEADEQQDPSKDPILLGLPSAPGRTLSLSKTTVSAGLP